jgi:hypothetical protein
MVLREGQPGLIAVERPAHGLEHYGFLSEQIGDEACAIVIVDPEDLQDSGIAQESSSALSVDGVNIGRNFLGTVAVKFPTLFGR